MKLIIGLGNPGPQYNNTRHNLGFRTLDALHDALDFPDWKEKDRLSAVVSEEARDGEVVTLAKPTTFMNNSGTAVAALKEYARVHADEIIVVHDDADLKLGTVKLEQDRGAGGHHGVESIMAALDTKSFWRLRCGIRTPERDASDLTAFALRSFHPDERDVVTAMIDDAVDRLMTWIEKS